MPTAWKTRPTWPATGGTGGDPLAVLVDGRLLQAVEIAPQVGPFDGEAGGPAAVSQLLLQHERQERAGRGLRQGGIGGMIDRPGAQDRLGTAEQVLDLQQIAVAKHRLQRGEASVGAQHEDAVVP